MAKKDQKLLEDLAFGVLESRWYRPLKGLIGRLVGIVVILLSCIISLFAFDASTQLLFVVASIALMTVVVGIFWSSCRKVVKGGLRVDPETKRQLDSLQRTHDKLLKTLGVPDVSSARSRLNALVRCEVDLAEIRRRDRVTAQAAKAREVKLIEGLETQISSLKFDLTVERESKELQRLELTKEVLRFQRLGADEAARLKRVEGEKNALRLELGIAGDSVVELLARCSELSADNEALEAEVEYIGAKLRILEEALGTHPSRSVRVARRIERAFYKATSLPHKIALKAIEEAEIL